MVGWSVQYGGRLEIRNQNYFIYFLGVVTLRKEANRPNYQNYEFQQLSLTSPLGKFSLDGSVVYDKDRPQYKADIKATNGNNKYVVVQGGYEKGAYRVNIVCRRALTATRSTLRGTHSMNHFIIIGRSTY
jgi:hypothetical protein